MDFKDRVVLITGGGSGIGAATGRYVAERGAHAVLAGIPADALEATAAAIRDEGGSALAVPTDVTDGASVENAMNAAVTAFGRLDGVVANAGIQRHNTDRDLFAMPESEWAKTHDVNSMGVVRTCKFALAQMMKQPSGGAIVIVSSITALGGGTPNVAYSTAKTGLLGLSRHIAVHYASHGIRCNAVCPGALNQTPDWADHPNPTGRKETFERAVPLGRLGSPEDIAPCIAFLLSDEARYATGAQFVVDGGITAR